MTNREELAALLHDHVGCCMQSVVHDLPGRTAEEQHLDYHRQDADRLIAAGVSLRSEPSDWHIFRDLNPDAPCPICHFPSWSHNPAEAVLRDRTLRSDELTVARMLGGQKMGTLGCPGTWSSPATSGYFGLAEARAALREGETP